MNHPNSPDNSQAQDQDVQHVLETRWRQGSNWFYWIGGLSLLNSIIFWAGWQGSFLFGLTMTRMVDESFAAMTSAGGARSGGFSMAGLILAIVIAGVFFLFGYLARQGHYSAYLFGMVLYLVDGFFAALWGEWLSLGFHLFALVGLRGGFRALDELTPVEEDQEGNPRKKIWSADPEERRGSVKTSLYLAAAIAAVLLIGLLIDLLRGG